MFIPNNDEAMPKPLDRVKSELELLREQNIKIRDSFFTSLIKDDPDFADIVDSLKDINESYKPKVRRNTRSDPSFKFNGRIPLEIRKSARLQNKEPIFTHDDLVDSVTYKRKRSDFGFSDLEEVIYRPKKLRISTTKRSEHYILPVEEVNDSMIKTIAKRGTKKNYSDLGTCCHQCRQKTMDQKTSCRNPNCVGVRGQFCGVCLSNRYGEKVAEALMDPNWQCPVCRGICNCSFCRAKAGKRPTGILAPLAQQNGHKSVKDLLDSLKGEGDYIHQDHLWHKNEGPDGDLLGFSSDLDIAYMSDGKEYELKAALNLEKMMELCQKEKLQAKYSESNGLLGFCCDVALTENGIRFDMKPSLLLSHLKDIINKKESSLHFTKSLVKMEIDVEEPDAVSHAGGLCGDCRETYNFCTCNIICEESETLPHPIEFVSVMEYSSEDYDHEDSSSFDIGGEDPLATAPMDSEIDYTDSEIDYTDSEIDYTDSEIDYEFPGSLLVLTKVVYLNRGQIE